MIARDEEGRYAFYRGENALGMVPRQREFPQLLRKSYNSNNYDKQDEIWMENGKSFDKLRRSKGKGVKVNKAIKK